MSNKMMAAIARAALPFREHRSLYYYAKSKMRMDPAYAMLAKLLRDDPHPILDLGCGAGVFAAFLREQGVANPIFGLDLDEKKIQIASRLVAAAYPALRFASGDAAMQPPWAGSVVALDILHYLEPQQRSEFLIRLARALPLGARLYLRNGVHDAGSWRHLATSAEEAFVRSSRWITGGAWSFPSRREVEATLRQENLAVVSVPMWGATPFSSYLFVAGRKS